MWVIWNWKSCGIINKLNIANVKLQIINYKLALRHIHPLLTLDSAKMTAHSIVSSRLDSPMHYCMACSSATLTSYTTGTELTGHGGVSGPALCQCRGVTAAVSLVTNQQITYRIAGSFPHPLRGGGLIPPTFAQRLISWKGRGEEKGREGTPKGCLTPSHVQNPEKYPAWLPSSLTRLDPPATQLTSLTSFMNTNQYARYDRPTTFYCSHHQCQCSFRLELADIQHSFCWPT